MDLGDICYFGYQNIYLQDRKWVQFSLFFVGLESNYFFYKNYVNMRVLLLSSNELLNI